MCQLCLQQGAGNQPGYVFTSGNWEEFSDPACWLQPECSLPTSLLWLFILHFLVTVCFNSRSQIMTGEGKFLLFPCMPGVAKVSLGYERGE